MANRRKTIVINKKFQYQYSLLVVALTVLAVNIFLIIRTLFPGDTPFLLDMPTAAGLAAIELLLVLGVWYGCLKASHRIAGPVYVFSREVSKLGDGDFSANISLRRKDMFQDIAAEMNVSFMALRSRIDNANNLIARLEQQGLSTDESRQLFKDLYKELGSDAAEGSEK